MRHRESAAPQLAARPAGPTPAQGGTVRGLQNTHASANAGSGMAETAPAPADDRRASVLADYRKVLLQHKEADAKVRSSERLRQNTCSLRKGTRLQSCAPLSLWQCERR